VDSGGIDSTHKNLEPSGETACRQACRECHEDGQSEADPAIVHELTPDALAALVKGCRWLPQASREAILALVVGAKGVHRD